MRLRLFSLLLLCAATEARLLRQTSTPSQQLTLSWALRWNVKDLVGAETACPAWNGTGFVPDAAAHAASVPRVQPDQAQLDAYVAKTCADSTGGAAALDSDLLAGGPTAQLAFLASVQSCTATSPKLAQAWFDVFDNPNTPLDWERVLKSVRAWVAAGDAQGVPACATVAMLDKYGDVVELRQLYLGSSNMAATPGGNCTTPPPLSPTPPLVPPSPTPVGPSPAPVSPPPITPGGGGLPPANASNTIYTSIRMNIGGTPCSLWNGTGWQTSTTEFWAASAKPAAIDWDKAMELVNKLCASPAIAGATLLAAFEQPGTTAANNAVAASIQSCPGSDDDWLGRLYMRTANPDGDHSDGSQTVSYAQKWVAAADAAGYALCVGVGQFSADGLVGNLVTVHNPTPWSGTGKPSTSGVVNAWALPKPDLQGQTISCKVWNGTGYSLDGSKWRGTVPYPAPVDPTQFKAYINAVCANNATAGSTLAAAIKAGGPTAQLAAYSMLYKCTDTSTVTLSRAALDAVSPFTSMDIQRAVSFAKAWRDASDSIGYPICVTVTFWDNGVLVNATQVHAGGETPGGGGGGSGGGISPPVINPPVITFGDAN